MSVTRADIAAALSTVPGVDGLPLPPRTPARGQGWAEWTRSTPLTYEGPTTTWEVTVTLPNGTTQDAVLAGDGLLEQVCGVLEDVGAIELVEPSTVLLKQAGAQGLPALTFTLTTV